MSIPSNKSINTAFHQDEGIILDTSDGLQFAFVPKNALPNEGHDRTFLGEYCQLIAEQFSKIVGKGKLIISDEDTDEPSARLILLDRDKIA